MAIKPVGRKPRGTYHHGDMSIEQLTKLHIGMKMPRVETLIPLGNGVSSFFRARGATFHHVAF